ncbi:hypothetical protein GRS96_04080 [Rathayibacter sp. VKM Ac-2803]|uniref:hypothetical protein n=1 Tax=unclassified Rathayibacter TaxID=2609250 RepID=UPI001357CFCB|nr:MULTISPECIES: hypothetical protein [unclassified Rathayibacter]MWV48453.1 hypothetical protein [Rathayibacter sp. VKM Ac-2803]MWV60793.1 hypothetical protein [Rathayibacter sp. VKM Ac-2754]
MLATILEVLSLVGIPLGLLVLGASLIALVADGRWISTTAYLEDGPPRALHWISDDGEVGSRALRDDDPLAPRGDSDRRSVYYREDEPARIRLHRRSEAFRVLKLVGLLLTGIGVACGIVSTVLQILGV